jgi:hypothetical protein
VTPPTRRCFFTLMIGLSPDNNWLVRYRPDMPNDPTEIRRAPFDQYPF